VNDLAGVVNGKPGPNASAAVVVNEIKSKGKYPFVFFALVTD
jgi:hypothetical protein